jgi:SAM-dependent methyltransferase
MLTRLLGRTACSSDMPNALRPLLNLGCGSRWHSAWTNADLVPAGPNVLAVDLRRQLPFSNATFDAVYSSHVLEHLTPLEARNFLREIRRVLRPGCVVRIVVPDLEGIVRGYLRVLDDAADGGDSDAEARWRHRWMTVELLDQLVRTQSGGAMGRWWSCDPVPCLDLIEERFGAEATKAIASRQTSKNRTPLDPADILLTPTVSDREALAFAARGERHKWMYDRVSLADALREAGFAEPRQMTAVDSLIPAFATYELDADSSGRVHKPDSLFMEALCPSH